jgi:hypothetical protein
MQIKNLSISMGRAEIIKKAVLNPELKEIIYQTKKVIKPRTAFRQHKRIGSFEKAEVKLNTTWDNKRVLLPN